MKLIVRISIIDFDDNISDHDNLMKTAEDIPNISFDHEEKICIKDEIKQEIKNEPLDKVHDGSNDDVVKRASDMSNICFDHEDNIVNLSYKNCKFDPISVKSNEEAKHLNIYFKYKIKERELKDQSEN